MSEFLKTRKFFVYILLTIGFFLFGIYIGSNNQSVFSKITTLSNTEKPSTVKTDFTPFWEAWNMINEKYPGASKITDQEKVYGAIYGLVGSLNDPYSTFFNPKETKSFEEDISGSFSGIGLEVGIKDKVLTAIAPLKDSPAYKSGIKPGDIILKINDKLTSDITIEEAIDSIRGKEGTDVTLTIFREDEKEPIEIKITRSIINTPTLETELTKDNIFIITLYSFSENSADLFRDAMKKFSESKTNKLILDLRGNPGGYLDSAVNISSWFLPSGKTVVIEDYGNNTKEKSYRSLGYDIFSDKLKFVILMDSGSASASEIVAGAMQDYKKAILVGDQSFGKGSVQEVVNVTPDTILKITVAKWLTPNGTSISEKGLTPDYKVEYTKDDFENKTDSQMEKAVELLKNWPK
jgi:carboxyl-terminal processing protease